MKLLFARLKLASFLPGSDPDDFVGALAAFLGELNHVHPFREGNGRTQQMFFRMLGQRAGHRFRLESIESGPFRAAMIESYHDRLGPLIDELQRLLA